MFLRKMLRHLSEELTGGWVKLNNGEVRDCTPSRMIFGHGSWNGQGMWHVRGEKCMQGFGVETWRKHNLTDLGEEGKIILKWTLMKKSCRTSTGFTSFRLVTSFRLLWTRWWTFGFYKIRGVSWLAEEIIGVSIRTLLHGVSQLVD